MITSIKITYLLGWLRGTVVECWSLTGELFLSCARLAAAGWPLISKPSAIGQSSRPTQPFILSV